MAKGLIKIGFIIIAGIGFMVSNGCQPEIIEDPDGEIIMENNQGVIIFNFKLPENRVPVDKVHRIDLSIAEDSYSLYSGYFIKSANVSDVKSSYSFVLDAGEYYYQAGITCECLGDTCLWDGYPGGQWGTKWTSGKIQIIKGEKIIKDLTFNN